MNCTAGSSIFYVNNRGRSTPAILFLKTNNFAYLGGSKFLIFLRTSYLGDPIGTCADLTFASSTPFAMWVELCSFPGGGGGSQHYVAMCERKNAEKWHNSTSLIPWIRVWISN